MVTKDWMSKWAIYSPHKIALKEYETGKTITYAQLNQQAEALTAYFFYQCQLKTGDRIAIIAENCIAYFILFSVAQKLGIILVPLNYRLSPNEIDYLLKDAEPSIIIYENQYYEKIKQTHYQSKINYQFNIERLHELNETQELDLSDINIEENDPIFILYTSGTTGFPKGAIYTHKMLLWNSINTSISLIVNTESRAIHCMPPFHTGGWNVLNTPFLHHGGYICIMKKFDANALLSLIEKEKPTILFAVPTMMKMMADLPFFKNTDMSSVLYAIVGGEPMPIPAIEQWHNKGVFIRQGYGMTEVGPNITSLHQEDAISKKGSIGRPNFYVQIKIVNELGQECQANEAGELLLSGPNVTPGYWRNEVATLNAKKNGWFHTGDVVIVDEEGYLFIVDRIKNMYISGGENVYPAEIERVIVQHPFVAEAAVIGVSDKKWGEVGKAFIVKSDERLTEEMIINYCQKNLAKFKIPKYFSFLSTLPKSDTGKIDKKLLKS